VGWLGQQEKDIHWYLPRQMGFWRQRECDGLETESQNQAVPRGPGYGGYEKPSVEALNQGRLDWTGPSKAQMWAHLPHVEMF